MMDKQDNLQGRPNDPAFGRPRVVVRFREGARLDDTGNLGDQIEQTGLGSWSNLLDQFPGITVTPVFSSEVRNKQLGAVTTRALELDTSYKPADFSTFFYIDAPGDTDMVALAKTLLNWNSVQTAYIDRAGPPPVIPSDDPQRANQGYLDPAPDGIDAEYAWTLPGGDGAGQRFIDLEAGWTLEHEDLAAHAITLLHGDIYDPHRFHGTAVLGTICAVDNAIGCVGIVPKADADVVSFYGSTRADAILVAIANLSFGDVLLIEAQVYLNGTSMLGPIEAYDAEFEAIRLATATGIIVIEAGGNGTDNGATPELNMDTYTTLEGKAILNRDDANPDFRDSGAIMVTAASAAAPHTRQPYAPHGRRVDCYAWGESITTLDSVPGSVTNAYTSSFAGTSGASAIIAGAALAVQGGASAQVPPQPRFGPLQMRAILSDMARGTRASPAETTQIRVMPDLRRIFNDVLNVAPDIYLRDFIGDTGEPHADAVSASPDVFLRRTVSPDPQFEFGAASAVAESVALSMPAARGQDNYIYVRVRNRGGTAATNVVATVFWAPVATLVTPNLWTRIGSVTLPLVPAGDLLTVSPALVWPKAAIPAPGHYCFVALIGTAADPAPRRADFLV
ncbi:S8 family serine peptidase [Massilia pseudoviolaceinigra]|uniref:S8 family serine peptidase n=1 Tax=Massilia pseudoviolaceinigra TaxID=3057165 RepID=UPI0027964325|nr:S8 family serine peptidase [Massilia sp. CCM 9206]MDQ1918931.1 S8 family serine peptidase [Massilia sp. CCM 9206]